MRHQELLFGITGQKFCIDVPEGRPQSSPTPTAKVVLATDTDVTGGEIATTGSVAIDSCDTTLTAAAAAGATSVTVNDASSVARGRRYLITAADGATLWVDVKAVNTGTKVVTLRRPLSRAFAIGATFQSTRMTIAVLDTWINDQSRISDILGVNWRTDREPRTAWLAGYAGYRIRWTYTVGGVATAAASFADVVRYSAKNFVTPADVDARFPGFIDRLPLDYQDDGGIALLGEAFYAFKLDAVRDDQALRRIRNTEIIHELVVYRANMLAVEAQAIAGAASLDQLKLARELYNARYDQLLREPKFQTDSSGSGDAGQAKRLPAFRR